MQTDELSTSWHSYPKIYSLGHKALKTLFEGDIIIEEKIDGSQFSFGKINGQMKFRSKGKEIFIASVDKLFSKAVESVMTLDLHDEWTYRGEVLCRPKHNCLAYDRIPEKNIIIFDINDGHESYLNYDDKKAECERLGLEVVPLLSTEKIENSENFLELLKNVSILGGQTIEGVVIKNYNQFLTDGHVLMGKYVSEKFKEVHKKQWGESNPGKKDILESIVSSYRIEARWHKAIQHLRENDNLDNSPKDIGSLIKEVQEDIRKECEDEIKDTLYKWAIPHICRGCVRGLPEWYKENLLNNQF